MEKMELQKQASEESKKIRGEMYNYYEKMKAGPLSKEEEAELEQLRKAERKIEIFRFARLKRRAMKK